MIIASPYTRGLIEGTAFESRLKSINILYSVKNQPTEMVIIDDIYHMLTTEMVKMVEASNGFILTKSPERYLKSVNTVSIFQKKQNILSIIFENTHTLTVIYRNDFEAQSKFYSQNTFQNPRFLKDDVLFIDLSPNTMLTKEIQAVKLWDFYQNKHRFDEYIKYHPSFGIRVLGIHISIMESLSLELSVLMEILNTYLKQFDVYYICHNLRHPNELHLLKNANQIITITNDREILSLKLDDIINENLPERSV